MSYPKIVGIVSIFNPLSSYCNNIRKMAQMVDALIIMDDSEVSHRHIVERVLSENITYYWNGNNIGLCKSINAGIRIALNNRADWILMMDQDSYPENDIVAVYKRYISGHNVEKTAILAPQYNYDRHPRRAHPGIRQISFANLSGSLINTKAILNFGLYDERFFVDGLDTEWCLRARKNHYTLLECSEAVIHHHPAETRYVELFGRRIFGYGYSTCDRYYNQIKACLLINDLYHDKRNVLILIMKCTKAFILYGDRIKFLQATIKAIKDHGLKNYAD